MNLDRISTPSSTTAVAAAPVAAQAVDSGAPKSNATKVTATDSVATTAPATVVRQFQLPVRVGGMNGFHDYLVLPQLADRAQAAGVEITLEVADKSWWKGTLYNVNVEGAPENVDRFIKLTLRDPVILA